MTLTAVGAYVYAGGFMVGLRRAGFDVLSHLEGANAYGVADAKLNWPGLAIHHGPSRWPLGDLRDREIDLLVANPPCAIFSAMGIRTTRGGDSWRTDPRLDHWWDSFRAFETVRPRVFALESVTQAYFRGRSVIDEMTKRSLVLGYSVTHLLLDAKWCGLPQSRRRFFIVAHRPSALVGYHHNWAPPPTVGEVLVEVAEPGHQRVVDPRLMPALRETPPGGGLSTAWERLNPGFETRLNAQGKVHGRPSFQDQRLNPTRQMGAFVGDKYYHPTEDRMIGVEEMKRLCGYPEDFRLAGNPSGWGSMIARAVMPPVGFWLGRAIAATLAQPDAAWGDRRVTLVDVREPGREPVDLTDQYLDAGGRVRLRARADGTVAWSWPDVNSKAPPAPAQRESPPPAPDRTPLPVVTLNAPGEGSGRFIQRLWRETDLSPDEILAAVHASFAGRTTARGDVYYNYKKLVEAGEVVRPWPGVRGRPRRSSPGAGASDARAAQTMPSAAPELAAERAVGISAIGATITGKELRRIAVLDFFPRVCGATDFGAHLVAGDPRYELTSASRSGRPLAAWRTPWDWNVLPLGGLAERLNHDYDAVVLTDVACLAPEMTERDGVPFYARELRRVTVPMTAVFHGGMAYKPVYDAVIDEIVRAPGFTGSVVTVREAQARERLARWPVRYVVHPFLPYRADRAAGTRATERRRVVMMTSRLASNKGQNALLAMLPHLAGDAEVWGYNSFGLPSIAWRLHELGQALGYVPDGEPALRRDMASLTHPNAPRFYTGAFAFTAPNGRRYAYRDGYARLDEINWSPWVHVAPFSADFHGLLEYTILDAIHAGAVAMVPEGTVPRGAYGALLTFPFDGCTLWAKKDGTVGGRDFDRAAVAAAINEVLGAPDAELERLAAAQLRDVRERHDPAVMRGFVERALRGEGT